MSMSVPGSDSGDDEVIAAINTTPLVDVMLVMLIIFLITIPVIVPTVKVRDADTAATSRPRPSPKTSRFRWTADGKIYWKGGLVTDRAKLLDLVVAEARKVPQPEIHIRGDRNARYEAIGRVIYTIQQGGIVKVGFLTEPVAIE